MLDITTIDNINLWVVFYTTRSDAGTPDQKWGDPDKPVYLSDHWEICYNKKEAIERYKELFDRYPLIDIHNAGIAPIDPEYSTGW